MAGYTPVFDNLLEGSLCGRWPENGAWVLLLAQTDKNGVIDKHPQYLSRVTGIPLEELMTYIERFEAPDPHSRTAEHEGRRLARLDPNRPWGWKVLNHGLYREKARKMTYDAQRTASGADAERKRLERERERQVFDDSRGIGREVLDDAPEPPSGLVPTCPDVSRDVPLSESEAKAEAEAIPETRARARDGVPRGTSAEVEAAYLEGLDAWREVTGISAEAMAEWLSHLASLTPPKPLSGSARIAAAKMLAGMGDDAAQLAVVRLCAGNGWRNLRHADAESGRRGGRESVDELRSKLSRGRG